jgi:predicted flap endonuclease-1-like 5' DNA nuclease
VDEDEAIAEASEPSHAWTPEVLTGREPEAAGEDEAGEDDAPTEDVDVRGVDALAQAPAAQAAAVEAEPEPEAAEPEPAAAPEPAVAATAASAGPLAEHAEIDVIEGVGPSYAERLRAAGVPTIRRLLDVAASAPGRQDLAARTGIRDTLILAWVNHADLLRVDGVDSQTAELLEAAGVDSPGELAQRNASYLTATLARVNGERQLVGQPPDEAAVARWVEHARTLQKLVSH